ncbi:hypothetical protein ASZ78_003406 [Callipepla squamata]|uniref:C2H2-type domain-containing protein n=1 Tax=Callipepla squamata TaxID=9009 RepID=A0A226MDX8_CALSU|nr:hypothetical protein ASZ78_003406 [Callipepla squamata]
MDPPRPHEGDRRRKRRELDARRSKCRIRLGGHLEQWCRLKEQLGFALHSQLAKFLLDRADSERCIPASEEKAEPQAVPREEEEEEEEEEDFAEEDDLAYTDDLRDENYLPSQDSDTELQRRQSQPHTRKKPVKEERTPNEQNPMDSSSVQEKGGGASCQQPTRPCDEDVAQIGPKRIRKAAKREILLCDFEGCGKIFSNRQYLNHHKKYQHVHQKTFTCSEPSCGKSFNFKKHLKEHEKLHSASLNWHMKKHDADAFYQFSCDLCGKKFEKKDNVTAHKSKSHPEAPPQAAPSPPPSAGTPQIELRGGDAPSGAEKGDGHPPPAH